MSVYFARELTIDGKPGPFVKIGVSGDPRARIKGSPLNVRDFVLEAVCKGGYDEEQALHARFSDTRVRPDREWFRLSPGQVQSIADEIGREAMPKPTKFARIDGKTVAEIERRIRARDATDADIARATGVHAVAVGRIRAKLGLPPLRKRMISPERRKAILDLVRAGHTDKEVASAIGHSHHGVAKLRKTHGIPSNGNRAKLRKRARVKAMLRANPFATDDLVAMRAGCNHGLVRKCRAEAGIPTLRSMRNHRKPAARWSLSKSERRERRNETIVARAQRGDDPRDIARDHGVMPATVYWIAGEAGVAVRSEETKTKARDRDALELYKTGKSLAEVADALGVTRTTVGRAVRAWYQRRTSSWAGLLRHTAAGRSEVTEAALLEAVVASHPRDPQTVAKLMLAAGWVTARRGHAVVFRRLGGGAGTGTVCHTRPANGVPASIHGVARAREVSG